jgi:hypothetical protein
VLKREGTGWDVGSAVRFLLSDQARYIIGHVLVVDGGAAFVGAKHGGRVAFASAPTSFFSVLDADLQLLLVAGDIIERRLLGPPPADIRQQRLHLRVVHRVAGTRSKNAVWGSRFHAA